jgi:hypothetical protein
MDDEGLAVPSVLALVPALLLVAPGFLAQTRQPIKIRAAGI